MSSRPSAARTLQHALGGEALAVLDDFEKIQCVGFHRGARR
jgi:hypothetical protein